MLLELSILAMCKNAQLLLVKVAWNYKDINK